VRLPIPPPRRRTYGGGATQIRTGDKAFAELCLATWLWRHTLERTMGFEPTTLALARRCSTTEPRPHMAGDPGIEPGNDGVKVRCLTAWLIPNAFWWGDRGELNPRMSDPQSDALTTSPRPPSNVGIPHVMAGAAGVEPTLTVLETAVLPLNYAPK
jgi:hypothetical protein